MDLTTLSKATLARALEYVLSQTSSHITRASLAQYLKTDWQKLPAVSWIDVIRYLDLRDVVFLSHTAKFLEAHILSVNARFLTVPISEFSRTEKYAARDNTRLLPRFLDRLVSVVETDIPHQFKQCWFNLAEITLRFQNEPSGSDHTDRQLQHMKKLGGIAGCFALVNDLTKTKLAHALPKAERIAAVTNPGLRDELDELFHVTIAGLGFDLERQPAPEPPLPHETRSNRSDMTMSRSSTDGYDTKRDKGDSNGTAAALELKEPSSTPSHVFTNVHEGSFSDLDFIDSAPFSTFCQNLLECYPNLTSIRILRGAIRFKDLSHLPKQIKKVDLWSIEVIFEVALLSTSARRWKRHAFYDLESFTVSASNTHFEFIDMLMHHELCKWKHLKLHVDTQQEVDLKWTGTFPPCLTRLELTLEGAGSVSVNLSKCTGLKLLSIRARHYSDARFDIMHIPASLEHVCITLNLEVLLRETTRKLLADVLSVAPYLASFVVVIMGVLHSKDWTRVLAIQRENILGHVKATVRPLKTFFDIRLV